MDVKVTRVTKSARIIPTTCVYWLAGKCNRNPCRFLHSQKPSSCNAAADAGFKRHHSYVYQRSFLKHKKIGDDKDRTQLVETSLSKHNTDQTDKILDGRRDTAQVAEVSQNPSPTICKYWVNDSCVHGDQCPNLHSWFYGDRLTTIAKLQGHNKLITGMTIPRGFDKLLTGSTDGTVRTWDCHTGQCDHVETFGSEVTSLISEGPWIFVGLLNTVLAYNIQTASQYTLDGPIGQVRAMTVGNDSLLAGAENGVISAWKGSSEGNSPFKLVASLEGHTKSVVCLVIGTLTKLYSGSEDQSIKVWDLETFECKMTLNAHIDAVTSLICSNKFLLSGSSDCTIKVWFPSEEGNLEVIHSHNVENGVVALSGMHDPDMKPVLLCSTRDNSVHLYELPSFVERGRLFAKQEVGSVYVGPGGLFFTGDRSGLLTVSTWLGEFKHVDPLES